MLARYSIRKVGFLRGMGWLMLRREVGAGVVGIHSTFSAALARNLAPRRVGLSLDQVPSCSPRGCQLPLDEVPT